MKTIAVVGTHCTGKTTLCYKLCASLRMHGKNAILVNESARMCPFPINEGQTAGTTEWIALQQRLNVLNAQAAGYEFIICDRSPMDSCLYHMARFGSTQDCYTIDLLKRYMRGVMYSYDKIILLSRGKTDIVADGRRSEENDIRDAVDKIFLEYFFWHFKDDFIHYRAEDLFKKRVDIDPETLRITCK
ncbi:MAG: ATP-binding protein [Puniceicoccales bacterium]|nr:ATP-binding protein [Puniceicoccales bacterium]